MFWVGVAVLVGANVISFSYPDVVAVYKPSC